MGSDSLLPTLEECSTSYILTLEAPACTRRTGARRYYSFRLLNAESKQELFHRSLLVIDDISLGFSYQAGCY